jgi:hypothetical protein
MTAARGRHDFHYMHADIPDGIRIAEWRTRRAAERVPPRMTARAARQCRRRRWLLRWIRAWRVPASRSPVGGRPAHG